MAEKSDATVAVAVEVEDGAIFSLQVRNAPPDSTPESIVTLLGDFWPPLGCRVVSDRGVTPERSFEVDVAQRASLLRFESDFGLYVAEKLRDFVAVHAALIGFGDRVVMVPGSSHSGKSTLAHSALSQGFPVLADEYALINIDSGRVTPWARPIRRRLPSGDIDRVALPGTVAEVVVSHVIVTKFDGEHSPSPFEPMSPGDVALGVLANTVCAQSRPEESLMAVAELARNVQGFGGKRGEANAAIVDIARLVGGEAGQG
jgi:hypothetical protein